MDASYDKLVKLKKLFSQFETAINDCNECSENSKGLVDYSVHRCDAECITRKIVCQPQNNQETLADRPCNIVPGQHCVTEEGSTEYHRCDFTRNHHEQLYRQQHQNNQETINEIHAGTNRNHSIGLWRIGSNVDYERNSPTLQSQYSNDQCQDIQKTPDSTLAVIAVGHRLNGNKARNSDQLPIPCVTGRCEISGLRHIETEQETLNGQHFEQKNKGQETDDFDEEVFKNFVESSNDLDDVEYSFEGQNNLPSVIETLAEREVHDINLLPHYEGATHNTPEPLNSLDLSATRLVGSIDNTKMSVQTSDQKGKKLCCPFCNKLFCKLSRHVESIHIDKAEVQKLNSLPIGPEFKKERRSIQKKIQTAGLLKWNTDPSVNTTRELIVPRRPSPSLNRKATDFLICPNCTSFHTITNLRKHFKTCTNGALKGARNIKILSRAIEGRSSKEASEQLRKVIPVMRDDEIVQLIRYDWLLIAYGNILCMKYHFHFQQNMIRAKLRLAGRVLYALRNIDSEVTDFASIFRPKRYKALIEAIKVVGKFNLTTNEFGAPGTGATAITSVKQIGSILKCEYIQREDSDHVKRTDDFLYLMDSEFSAIIRKRVKESQMAKRREKDHRIPSKEDVRLFSVFVKRERCVCFEQLSAMYDYDLWVKLSELTIASIIVFNRRRTGESQNILVSDFTRRESINETSNEELFRALSEESKKVAKLYSRMKIRGKKGVLNVNVLLPADLIRCIELLLSHRVESGVPSDNPFLFALPPPPGEDRIRVVNACKVLASLSNMCGAKDPSTLRGTNLRKHFATACMAKELSDDMVSEVAKFMGHREDVHRQNYRINTIDREVVKIAKLLLSAGGIEGNEDDASDSDSDNSDDENEDYITIPKPASRSGPTKRKNITENDNAPSKKQKKSKNAVKAVPPKLTKPFVSSNKTPQKHAITKGKQLEKACRKQKKIEAAAPGAPSVSKCKPKTTRKSNNPVKGKTRGKVSVSGQANKSNGGKRGSKNQ